MYKFAAMKNGKFVRNVSRDKAEFINSVDFKNTNRSFNIANVNSIHGFHLVVLRYDIFEKVFLDKVFTDYVVMQTVSPTLKTTVYNVIINVKFSFCERFAINDIVDQMKNYYSGVFYDSYPPVNSYITLPSKSKITVSRNIKQSLHDMYLKLSEIKPYGILPKYSVYYDIQEKTKQFKQMYFNIKGVAIQGINLLSFPLLFYTMALETNKSPKEVDKMLTIKDINYIKAIYLSNVIPLWMVAIEHKEVEYDCLPVGEYIGKHIILDIKRNRWKYKLGDWMPAIQYPLFSNLYKAQRFLQDSCNTSLLPIFKSKTEQCKSIVNVLDESVYTDYLIQKYGNKDG